jgi:DNA repair protein RadA/Sms
MAKEKILYQCSNCNYSSSKWLGKCPSCNSWNTFEETLTSSKEESKINISSNNTLKAKTFEEILQQKTEKNV